MKRIGRPPAYAHRVAWEQAHGPIPDGYVVMHRCDNPPCFNVEHLTLGRPVDNVRDAKGKGRLRHGPLIGEKNPNARLTARQVGEIRKIATAAIRPGFERFKRGSGLAKKLSEKYGVSTVMIWNVIKRRNWKD